ncbi:MAG: lipid-A-disaccharide synthase-related protein [Microcoleaceae cyanobacterium]
MRLLCLSNGHGEDAIAVQILTQLQQLPNAPQIAALPIVGTGQAYKKLGNIPIISTVKSMPSGGFIYMDGGQFIRDINQGLIGLTFGQIKAVRNWAKQGGMILAVGDIVPLLMAWVSGAPYAFVGTAKSEYYLRDEQGWLSRTSWQERWEGWSGSDYLPWERWLISRQRCKAVFPRDTLTAEILSQWSIPVVDAGNPMMDHLQPPETVYKWRTFRDDTNTLTLTLLPGSRIPEAYQNWDIILQGITAIINTINSQRSMLPKKIVLFAAIAPSLNLDPFCHSLKAKNWHELNDVAALPYQLNSSDIIFHYKNATLILTSEYNACLDAGEIAIAMAGTATEQFVGLGKPAIAIPGKGPQFTPKFAEAQSRLLGLSLKVVSQPSQVPEVLLSLWQDSQQLQIIAENGQRRLGKPGAASRIAQSIIRLSSTLEI